MGTLRHSLVLISLLLNGFCAHAGGVVTAATEENLRAALVGGGNVSFAMDGKISLSNTLIITNNTTIDATGHSVVLSGGGTVRVLQVQPGSALGLTRLTIADGYTLGTGAGQGGAAMLCLGRASITECAFSNNVGGDVSARGGAIFHAGNELELNRSLFIRNRSESTGGAITCISGTFGGAGGTHATNCTFYANSSAEPGGGVSASGSFTDPLVFVNCTFAWNTNGAIYFLGQGGSPNPVQLRPVLVNSVVAYSVALSNAMAIVDDGNNICSDDSASFDNVTSLKSTDPILGPAGNYGGATWTLPLLVGSPATDFLNSSLAPVTDQRGVLRPVGLRSDAGAFEGNLSTNFPVAFRFTSSAYSVVEGEAAAEVRIERLGSSETSASVGFSAQAGTATAGQDFLPTNTTVPFEPGEMQKTVLVSILDDALIEGDETILLSLEGTGLEVPNTAVLTIVDNDLPTVISDYTDAALRAAIAVGGSYQFGSDGTIALTNTITVTRPTVLDATGHNVTIAGDSTFRLFTVDANGALELRHIGVTGGYVKGQDGGLDMAGGDAFGGAILVSGGLLTLFDCQVCTNGARGGTGGPTSDPNLPKPGGRAAGGAIYVDAGVLNATNVHFQSNWVDGGTGGDNPPGVYSGNGGDARGAAIGNSGGTLNVISNRFVRNVATGGAPGSPPGLLGDAGSCGAGAGGAIYQSGGTSIAVECGFESNTVTSLRNPATHAGDGGIGIGGAICNTEGTMALSGDKFSANLAAGSSPGLRFGAAESIGGAVANYGQMEISDCTFRSNTAVFPGARLGAISRGGAIANFASVSVNRSYLEGNRATSAGGGMGGVAYGGAVYNSGTCGLTNDTLAANVAHGGELGMSYGAGSGAFGGGIFNSQVLFSINNTIANNSSEWIYFGSTIGGEGGGLYVTNGALYVLNTILASNLLGSNSSGTLSDLGHNLSSDSSCNFSAKGGLDNTSPKLGPLGMYGGPTATLPLLADSAAIDAGGLAGAPAIDQRGHNRPYGNGIDIGAFESSPPFVIAGRVYGSTFTGRALVSASAVSTLTTDSGSFILEGLEPGDNNVIPTLTEYVFVPPQQSVTTGPDQFGVDFHAFRVNALSPEGTTNGQFHVVFAGASGATFRLFASTNLIDWQSVSTNTITANRTFDCFLPTTGKSLEFYRAVTP